MYSCNNDKALRINFSTTNNHGVVRNSLACGSDTAPPNIATISDEITKLFGGDILKLAIGCAELTEEEKAAFVGHIVPRYSSYDVSYVVGKYNNPTATVSGYLAGIYGDVALDDVKAFILNFAKMPDLSTPDFAILGKPKYRA